jgi:hypothetical protein
MAIIFSGNFLAGLTAAASASPSGASSRSASACFALAAAMKNPGSHRLGKSIGSVAPAKRRKGANVAPPDDEGRLVWLTDAFRGAGSRHLLPGQAGNERFLPGWPGPRFPINN